MSIYQKIYVFLRKFDDMDYDIMTGIDWVRLLGERFRSYRMALEQTQEEIACKSGVTVQTVRRFESGKARNLTIATLVALMKTVGMAANFDALLPEIPLSPYLMNEIKGTEKQRIRHKKK